MNEEVGCETHVGPCIRCGTDVSCTQYEYDNCDLICNGCDGVEV